MGMNSINACLKVVTESVYNQTNKQAVWKVAVSSLLASNQGEKEDKHVQFPTSGPLPYSKQKGRHETSSRVTRITSTISPSLANFTLG